MTVLLYLHQGQEKEEELLGTLLGGPYPGLPRAGDVLHYEDHRYQVLNWHYYLKGKLQNGAQTDEVHIRVVEY